MTHRTAGILIIGDEVLSGKVEDQNSPYLCRELRQLGVDVQRLSVLPDVVSVIGEGAAHFSRQFDYVFTSGGVGPTHDDVTIEGIANGFGVPVVRLAELEKPLRKHFGNNIPEAALKMTEVPEGAKLLWGDSLLFPLITFRNLYIFPGVPQIFRRKFEAVKERFRAAPYFLNKVYLTVGEVEIAAILEQAIERIPTIKVGSYPRWDQPEYQVLVTVESKDEGSVQRAVRYLQENLPHGSILRIE
ncbi:MAG: competence/damage-inducible protein A [Deltaproteobacteria bacterium]|nr:competence/damage-inducible protein A [Deltaproteobacteria bacterium]